MSHCSDRENTIFSRKTGQPKAKSISLTSLRSMRYDIECTVGNHVASGMKRYEMHELKFLKIIILSL